MLDTKPDSLSSNPSTTRWKERTDGCKMPSDLHMHTLAHVYKDMGERERKRETERKRERRARGRERGNLSKIRVQIPPSPCKDLLSSHYSVGLFILHQID